MPAFGVGLGVLGLTSGIGSILGFAGANEQADAAREASEAQIAEAAAARQNATELGAIGADAIRGSGIQAGEALGAFGAQGLGEIQQGRDMALGQILGFGGLAEDSLRQGFAAGEETLGAAGLGARQDLLTGVDQFREGIGDATNLADQFRQQSRVQALMDDPTAFQQDPGFQFRLQQGEDAINRSASARGGRLSGRTLQELQRHGQGLASQEFGQAMNRAQAADAATLQSLGQQGQFQMQGAGGLAGLQRALAGQQMGLGGQLAGLQVGGGQAVAGQQSGMGTQLGNLFTGTGSQLGQANLGLGSQFGNLLTGIGTGQANAAQGAAAQGTQLTQSLLPQMAIPAQSAGAGLTGLGQNISQMGGNAMAAMMMAGQSGSPAPSSMPAGVANPSISAPIPPVV